MAAPLRFILSLQLFFNTHVQCHYQNTLLTFIELYKTLASYDAVSIRRHSTASCNCSSSKTGLTASSRTYWTQQIQDSITQNRLASLRRSVGRNEYEGSIEASSVGNKKKNYKTMTQKHKYGKNFPISERK